MKPYDQQDKGPGAKTMVVGAHKAPTAALGSKAAEMEGTGNVRGENRPDEPGYTDPGHNQPGYEGTEPDFEKQAPDVASAIGYVTKVEGEKVKGMNFGPSIGRFDAPPYVVRETGTAGSIAKCVAAHSKRRPEQTLEHVHADASDRNWR